MGNKSYPADFKAKLVLEILTGFKTVDAASREHDISPQTILRWRSKFLQNASLVFERHVDRESQEQRLADLERLAGRLSLELEAAKKASNILQGQLLRGGK